MAVIPWPVLRSDPIVEGGEGKIYRCNGKILKVYKPACVDLAAKEAKVKALIAKRLPSEVVAPQEMATDPNGKFIGYLMNEINGDKIAMLVNRKYIKANNITVKFVLDLVIKIRDTLIALHRQKIFIGDFTDTNVLFTFQGEVFFIDTDSWTVDGFPCDMATDGYCDPTLTGLMFSEGTDGYAFAIISFQSLTRVHPFGGTMVPEMSIIDRMGRKLSVLGDHGIKIPPMAVNWRFMHPRLIKDYLEIFECEKRFILSDNLNNFAARLTICQQHSDYYYSEYTSCPLCSADAKILIAPVQVPTEGTIPIAILSSPSDIKIFFDYDLYLSNDNYVVHASTGKRILYIQNTKVYFSNNAEIVYVLTDDIINIHVKGHIDKIPCAHKSRCIVKDNHICYINPAYQLSVIQVNPNGNQFIQLGNIGSNTIFEYVGEKHYFSCSFYDATHIVIIDGYCHTMNAKKKKLRDYGIHYDLVTEQWLFVYQLSSGKYHTYIFNKSGIVYSNDALQYSASELGNICFYNGIIYGPTSGQIRGFNSAKNLYKDFPCSIVNEDSKLIKIGVSFVVVNEKTIYRVG